MDTTIFSGRLLSSAGLINFVVVALDLGYGTRLAAGRNRRRAKLAYCKNFYYVRKLPL